MAKFFQYHTNANMPPVEAKTITINNNKFNTSDNSTTTLYSRICELQPLELLQRLDKEGISTRGADMPGLRARLLRHKLRQIYAEANVALHKDLELMGKEAENWCAMMHLWEIDMRAKVKMREQQERSCLIVDRKLDYSLASKKPFENDVTEKNRVDYLLSCVNLLKSWDLQYSSAKDQDAKYFLESLIDFRKFAEINDQVLLLMLPSVLTNEAKFWYRSNNFISWEQFEAAFIQRINTWTQQRSPPSVTTTTSTNKVPQIPKHSAQLDMRPTGEGRMSQSFAFDTAGYGEAHKQKIAEQEQLRPQLVASPLRMPRHNADVDIRRLREQELQRTRYIEYLQQSRLNCMKERLQPYPNVTLPQMNVRLNCEKKVVDKSTQIVKPMPSSHFECMRKLRLWHVKYSGEKGRAVIEFVDDLTDFRKYANVNDVVLLEVLPCVLSGIAKSWFRNPSLLKKRWSTWEEFKEEFLKRFYDSEAAEEGLKNIINGVDQL